MDASLTDNGINSLFDLSDSNSTESMFRSVRKYAGFLGDARVIEEVFSLRTIVAIVGLSTGFSCTHNKLI